MQNAAYIEAKKGMLKTLSNKMYSMELEDYKKGKGPKPAPVKQEMKQTKTEQKTVEKEAPKMTKHVKDMVRGFFKEKKQEDNKDIQNAGFVRRGEVKAEAKPPRKRRRVRKKKD